jgi:hypothetical protein
VSWRAVYHVTVPEVPEAGKVSWRAAYHVTVPEVPEAGKVSWRAAYHVRQRADVAGRRSCGATAPLSEPPGECRRVLRVPTRIGSATRAGWRPVGPQRQPRCCALNGRWKQPLRALPFLHGTTIGRGASARTHPPPVCTADLTAERAQQVRQGSRSDHAPTSGHGQAGGWAGGRCRCPSAAEGTRPRRTAL